MKAKVRMYVVAKIFAYFSMYIRIEIRSGKVLDKFLNIPRGILTYYVAQVARATPIISEFTTTEII